MEGILIGTAVIFIILEIIAPTFNLFGIVLYLSLSLIIYYPVYYLLLLEPVKSIYIHAPERQIKKINRINGNYIIIYHFELIQQKPPTNDYKDYYKYYDNTTRLSKKKGELIYYMRHPEYDNLIYYYYKPTKHLTIVDNEKKKYYSIMYVESIQQML